MIRYEYLHVRQAPGFRRRRGRNRCARLIRPRRRPRPAAPATRDGGARDRAAAPAVSGAHNRAGRPPDRGGRRGRRAARSARWPRWTGPGHSRCRAEDLLRQLVERKLQVPAKPRWRLATPDEALLTRRDIERLFPRLESPRRHVDADLRGRAHRQPANAPGQAPAAGSGSTGSGVPSAARRNDGRDSWPSSGRLGSPGSA